MITSREDFLMTLLNCGSLYLKLIDDVGYDWCDILDTDVTEGLFVYKMNKVSGINYIMRQVVEYGFNQIENAIDERIEYLRETQENYGISDEQKEELAVLEQLDVWEDFESYYNCIDTHVWCEKHGEIYRKYMRKALDDFAEGTGFEIDINND